MHYNNGESGGLAQIGLSQGSLFGECMSQYPAVVVARAKGRGRGNRWGTGQSPRVQFVQASFSTHKKTGR
jgi:hypothetical protein